MATARAVCTWLLLAASIAGCGTSGDEAPAASRGAHPLATRIEAQRELDSAVGAFRRGEPRVAGAQLRAAAVFFRAHPDLASSTARGAFGAVALDLERLASEIEAGRSRDSTVLGTTIARAQLAEAEHHRGRAATAWLRGDTIGTGEELALCVDHLERALCDARLTRSPAGVPMVRQARTLTLALLRGGALPADVGARLDAVAREVRRLDASTRTGAG